MLILLALALLALIVLIALPARLIGYLAGRIASFLTDDRR